MAPVVVAGYLVMTGCQPEDQTVSDASVSSPSTASSASFSFPYSYYVPTADELTRAGYIDYADYLDHGTFATERSTLRARLPGDDKSNPIVAGSTIRDRTGRQYQYAYPRGGIDTSLVEEIPEGLPMEVQKDFRQFLRFGPTPAETNRLYGCRLSWTSCAKCS